MRRVIATVLLVFLVLLGGAVGPLAAAADTALARQGGDDRGGELDLSAMLLTPYDLEDAGLEGYALRGGGTDTLDDEFTGILATDDRPADEVEEILDEAGLIRSRWAYMDLPSEEDAGYAARRVTVWVDEFSGSEGLSDVIDVYLDFGGGTREGNETIGDESRIATYTDRTTDTDVEIQAMVLAFSYENLIGQIDISEYQTQTPDIEPSVDEIEALAERLLERMETVLDDGGPGLESQILRLESDGEHVFYSSDYYTRLDDQQLPRYGQDEESVDDFSDAEADYGITDAYRMVQLLEWNGESGIIWSVQIRAFDDEDGAEAWVDDAEDWIESFDVEDIEVVDDDVDLGDHAVAVTFRQGAEDEDIDPNWTAIFIQVGDVGILIQLGYPGEHADLDIVTELAELQVECVEEGGCPVETELPDVLQELADTLS